MTIGSPSPASANEDGDLAERFRGGDADAFGQLYARHYPTVYRLVARVTADATGAEDLAQASFLRAWERREGLRHPRRFRAWLLATARNLALEHRRQAQHAAVVQTEWKDLVSAADTEGAVLRAETPSLVRSAASSLEPRHREVLHLSLEEDLSNRELAMVLGITTGHAAVLVHRAKRALRSAVRTLLVATRARECTGLQRLVPSGLQVLSRRQNSAVDRHMRRCAACAAAADRLTDPARLLGALTVLAPPVGWDTEGVHGLHAAIGHLGSASHGLRAAGAGRASAEGSRISGHAAHIAAGVTAAAVAAGAVLIYLPHRPGPPAPAAPAPPTPAAAAGRVFVTGDDPDVHAHYGPNASGARHVIQAAVRYVTAGKPTPRMLLVTDLRDPGGPLHGDPRLGFHDAGYAVDVADYGSGAAGVLDLHTVRFSDYDAVIVASDFGGWLRQEELDILDARRADLVAYAHGGGGVIGFAEGGATAPGSPPLTTHGFFGFLPTAMRAAPLSEYEIGVTVAPAGYAMGLSNADEARNYLHAAFTPPPGATPLVVDSSGRTIAFSMSVT